jgi:hypothetical protein
MTERKFSAELLHYASSHNPAPPSHMGTRYGKRGGFLREPGNTVVSHVAKGSETERVLIDIRDGYLDMPEADKLLLTPVTSLHMTLFQGIIEYRRKPGFWPADLPLDTPIDDMTEMMAARLEGFQAPDPFSVIVSGADPAGLTVEGRREEDRRAMRAWRDAFADLLGYRHPNHDTYVYHITFAYPIERLSDAALPAWQSLLDDIPGRIAARVPELELTPPAFCVFEDMNHFHEILIFDPEEDMEAIDG